jgi:cytidine deaminase
MASLRAAELIRLARRARENAVAPYSRFRVGAALEAASGTIYGGCNVENATYGLTVCAERVALWKALSEGEREFKGLAVVTDAAPPATPCGACRQLLWEFCGDLELILANLDGREEHCRLSALFPAPFDRSILPER